MLLTVPHLAQPRTQAATDNQQHNMQNYCKTIGALAAASALVAGNTSAGTTTTTTTAAPMSASAAAINYELHAGYATEYLFRGTNLGDGLVETGLDASANLGDGFSLSAGAWMGTFFNSPNTTESSNSETDLYTEVSKDFGFMTGSVGYIYYANLGALGRNSQEVSFAISRDFGFATASYTYFWGVQGQNNQGYSELALSRGFELSSCLKLNLSTDIGYLTDGGLCTAWTTKAALDWSVAEHAKLSPFVALAVALDEKAGSAWAQTQNEYVAGAKLSVGF